MFKKEPSEEIETPDLAESVVAAGPVKTSSPTPIGNTMALIGAVPLVLFLISVLVGNRIIGLVLLLVAAAGCFVMWKKSSTALSSSLGALRDEAFAVANDDLPRLGQALSSGAPVAGLTNDRAAASFSDPDFQSVAAGLTAVRESAAGIGDNVSSLQKGISDTYVNLARRNQALVDRQLEAIDTLEAEERDSDRLSLLYRVDHLATRMHRNAESLLVLADAKTPERHSPAVALREVLRVAIGEVEDYRRIVPISLDEMEVAGHKAQDMAHLLAELMENAAQHSPPGTAVDVTGVKNLNGDYTITILDHGTGVAPDHLESVNALLERPPTSTLTISHSIGLQVVSRISHTLGIKVRLDHGEGGGVIASVFVPSAVAVSWGQSVSNAADEAIAAPSNGMSAFVAPSSTAPAPVASAPDVLPTAPASGVSGLAPIPDLAAPAVDVPPIPDLAAPAVDVPSIPDLAAPAVDAPTFPTIGEDLPTDSSLPLESLLDPATGLDDDSFQMPLPAPIAEAPDVDVPSFEAPSFDAPAEPEVFEPGNSTFEMPSEPDLAEAVAPAPPASVVESPSAETNESAPEPAAPAASPAEQPVTAAPVAAAPVAAAPAAAAVAAPLAGAVATAPAEAEVASEPGKTSSGLTRRTRSAPSSTPAVNFDEGRTAPSQRSPDQVKSMLSRYKSGLERGRGSAETDGE